MAKVKFYAITSAQYTAITPKEDTALYFLTDTKEIFRGTLKYSQAVEFVTELPEATVAKIGVIYVDANNNASVSNGSTWIPFVSAQYSFQFRDAYSETATYASGDVVTYNGAMFKANGTPAVGTAPVAADGTVATGWTAMVANGTITGVSYANNVLTFTDNNGKTQMINLPAENFLSNASFDSVSNILTLTLSDSSTVTVNLEDLVEYNAVGNTDSIELSQDAAHTITAALKVSKETGNQVVIKPDGIFVGNSNVGVGKENEIIIAGISGEVQASGKKIGGETFADNPDANTVATEKAVINAINVGNIYGGSNEIIVANTNGKPTNSGTRIGGSVLNETASVDTVATEAAVKNYVDFSRTDLGSDNANEIVIVGADGKIIDSNKKIGGKTLAETTDANTVATEAAVEAAVEAALTWQTV